MPHLYPNADDGKIRCFGNKPNQALYARYHDEEWGVPVYDDNTLFEFIILEGAQAGLNWETILKKREGYREAFCNFDPKKVAKMTGLDLEKLQAQEGIIRNKLKIKSAVKNARLFLDIQNEFGSFSNYVWGFVNHEPIVTAWPTLADVPVTTKESEALSQDLKKRGMTFVGPTIMYAYMQAVGLVYDHVVGCWKCEKTQQNNLK